MVLVGKIAENQIFGVVLVEKGLILQFQVILSENEPKNGDFKLF